MNDVQQMLWMERLFHVILSCLCLEGGGTPLQLQYSVYVCQCFFFFKYRMESKTVNKNYRFQCCQETKCILYCQSIS